jgi:uncharacterized protein (TIGR03067 family)
MRVLCTFLFTAILLATVGCSKSQPTTPAALTLDGTYRLHRTNILGTWVYSGEQQDFEVVIKGETWTYTGKSWRGDPIITIKTDLSKNPATIDMIENRDGKVELSRGIYKLDGDELIIATGKKAGEENRPKDFTPSDGVEIWVYKRK